MRLAQVQDQELVRNYINGHEEALSVLVSRHQQKVFTYIRMLVKDSALAEDIFQDVFVKVIHTLKSGNYNEEGKFLPWIMRIAHNLSIDHFRKSKRIPVVQPKDDFDIFRTLRIEDDNVEDKMVKDQILKDVKKLIKELPAEQQEVLILRHYADMSFQEIADFTNVSINTALGRMRYALINLRKIVKQKDMILSA
ncbi:MAG TPA: sigma-70 family RNA polymerase sigma factor [Flavobacteriales bacterium]|jgi:RNA polymerase sigma factor (sigma-70 family)|nr:sigma-70 family RNA polymerase sigma factor [Flavobacteriales bacterium]HPH82093.1 sigma-70 family RNA polymerase sigma factor [Flavobacteriales bacterium]